MAGLEQALLGWTHRLREELTEPCDCLLAEPVSPVESLRGKLIYDLL